MAAQLARDLAARGVTVVSGLARGVDAAAHRAAIDAGGRTVAVLASGLANIYPPEHVELAEEVVRCGALLSEAPLDGPPIGNLFPLRNRIISGLCRGVVVVEAAARSGALSTAYHALDQNREVFAVPGRVGDVASAGANELLKKGAALVQTVDDILAQIGPIDVDQPTPPTSSPKPPAAPTPSLANDVERRVWEALSSGSVDLDTLAESSGLAVRELSSSLLMMEMRGVVARQPGNRFARR
jgi:DNA processing protein